jgi:hypothetical protein
MERRRDGKRDRVKGRVSKSQTDTEKNREKVERVFKDAVREKRE